MHTVDARHIGNSVNVQLAALRRALQTRTEHGTLVEDRAWHGYSQAGEGEDEEFGVHVEMFQGLVEGMSSIEEVIFGEFG